MMRFLLWRAAGFALRFAFFLRAIWLLLDCEIETSSGRRLNPQQVCGLKLPQRSPRENGFLLSRRSSSTNRGTSRVAGPRCNSSKAKLTADESALISIFLEVDGAWFTKPAAG